MNVVLKKKWGKPVTDVQRFVPQEYAVVCTTYILKAITDSNITDSNLIRIDINPEDTKYQENERSSYLFGKQNDIEVDESEVVDMTDIYKTKFYKYTGPLGGERVGTVYSTSPLYSSVTPSFKIYQKGSILKQSIYTGKKNQS